MEGNTVLPASTQLQADAPSDSVMASLFKGAGDKLQKSEKVTPERVQERSVNPSEPPAEIPFVDKDKPEEVQEEPEKPAEEVAQEEEPVSEEEAPEGQEETPEDKEKRAWGETKKALKAAKKELAELKARHADTEKATQELETLRAELKAVQEERESIDGEFYLHRVEATREFQKVVTKPRAEIKEQSEVIAKRNNLDLSALSEAIAKDAAGTPAPLEELVADLTERERQKVYSLADALAEVNEREADIRENSKSAYEAANKREQERIEQETKKVIEARENAVQKLIPKLEEELIKGMPEDNRPDIARLRKEVLSMDQWPEELKVYGGVAAAVMPYLVDSNKALQAEINELKATNSKLRGAAPAAGGGKPPTAPAEAEKPTNYSGVQAKDFVKSMVARMGLK